MQRARQRFADKHVRYPIDPGNRDDRMLCEATIDRDAWAPRIHAAMLLQVLAASISTAGDAGIDEPSASLPAMSPAPLSTIVPA